MPRAAFPWLPAMIVFVVLLGLGAVAYLVNETVAGILYIPVYLIICWTQPAIALWMMFAEVCFPYNISGAEIVHIAPAEISLVLASFVFFIRSVITRKPVHIYNPMLIPILIYFAICIVSTLVHWSGRDAIVSLLQMALYLLLAVKFFSAWVPDRRWLYAAIYGLFAGSTFMSVLLIVLRTNDILGVQKNATGTFISYAVLMLAELYMSAYAARRGKKWITVLLMINVAGLIMSTSRGAWLGTAAGLMILLFSRRQFALFARTFVLMIPAIAVCWFLVPAEQRDYAFSMSSSQNTSVGSRVATIQTYETLFMQSPVIGVGVGLRKEIDSTNIIMSTLAETGVAGLLAFMAIDVCLIVSLFLAMRYLPRTHPDYSFLTLGAALVLCLLVHGCVDHYWSRTQVPVWAMAGAAIAVAHAARARAGQALT
jgi:hypothetical protein